MKRIFILIIIISIIYIFFIVNNESFDIDPKINPPKISELSQLSDSDATPKETIITENLEIPWSIAFLPNGGLLVTERVGRVRLIDKDFNLNPEPILILENVMKVQGEGGLHGIVLHPNFKNNKYVYIYYTYTRNNNVTLNKVERYVFNDQKLSADKTIIDSIPGSLFHDGGRIKFGPDQLLYITTGDAQKSELAQDINSLAGKILRISDEGDIPTDNPFGNAIYSYGHRNPQGIDWDENDKFWSTEHGRSGVLSGLDEINLIEPGKNFGWPIIQGDETKTNMIKPIKHSGANSTWAPACAAIIDNRLFFSGLRGEALYEALIIDDQLSGPKEYYKNEFGRIRECIKGPDDMLYITTSNRDGRGNIQNGDDKIIRINPRKL